MDSEEGLESGCAGPGVGVVGRVEVLVGRGRRSWLEAERDVEVLAWVARFRFVTADLLAGRFGVSVQSMNARLRRLEGAGLVGRERAFVGQEAAVFVTGRGASVLGVARRRPPRTGLARDHELGIVWTAIQLELCDEARVLAERECRALDSAGTPCSVRLGDGSRRWPDLVAHTRSGRRVAFELEFSPKGTSRLEAILAAYAQAPHVFDETRFLVTDRALSVRIRRLITSATMTAKGASAFTGLGVCVLTVAAWPGLPAPERAAIDGAIRR